jgi:hypothetical protein
MFLRAVIGEEHALSNTNVRSSAPTMTRVFLHLNVLGPLGETMTHCFRSDVSGGEARNGMVQSTHIRPLSLVDRQPTTTLLISD